MKRCPSAPDVPGLVGDPIDVVSGANVEQTTDCKLDGPMLVRWVRVYDSRWNAQDRGLGVGHRHGFDHWLLWDVDGITHVNHAGYESFFPKLQHDGQTHGAGGYTLERASADTYFLHRRGEPTRVFHRPSEQALEARLVELREDQPDGRVERVALTYDERGRLEKVLVRQHEALRLEYDAADHIIAVHYVRDEGQRKTLVRYRYDGRGCLIEGSDAYGATFTFEYDAERRLTARADRRGYRFFFEYDPEGRCIRSRGEDGVLDVQLNYRPAAYETEVFDANGGLWLYQYLPNGIICCITDPYGGKRRFEVDDQARVVAEYDEKGTPTRYRFDAAGCPIAKVTPDGEVIALPEGDDDPDPKHHRVPALPVEWEYGDLWEPGFTLPDEFETIEHLPLALRSLLETSETPERGKLAPVRDEQGLLLREEAQELHRSRVYGYDKAGCYRRIQDLDGQDHRFEFGSFNLLKRQTDAEGDITSYDWTPTLEIAGVTDASGTETRYQRDLKDRIVAVHRGGALRESYKHDKTDHLIEKRDANGELLLSLEYDHKGHKTKRELASGDVHEFAYDENGRVTYAWTLQHECTFAYDSAGRRVEDKRDGRGVEHRFGGEHLLESTVLDRFRTTYQHGRRTTTITDPTGATVLIRRHGRGLVSRELEDGRRETTQYHPRGWVVFKSLWNKGDPEQGRWDRRYRYSGEGDLLAAEDSERGATRHEHDGAHRLVKSEHPDGRVDSYKYNRAGALFESPTMGTGTVGQLNQLRYTGGERFAYNHRHHLAERESARGKLSYDYDSRDQLGSLFWEGKDGSRWGWDADYDPLGRRVRKNPGYIDQGWQFFWDTDRLAAEIAPDGKLRVYVYADAFAVVPVAFIDYDSADADPEDGRRYDLFTDQRGCVERVTDASGAVVWKAQVDPYGHARVEVGQDFHQPLRMPGHYADTETGLHYNRFRYYDPALGRYLQSDPSGLAGGLNLYAYPAAPLTSVDVRGLTGTGTNCPPTGARPARAPEPEGGPDAEGPPLTAAQRRQQLNRDLGLDRDGLTPDQRREYNRLRQTDEWAARRYRYERSRENRGEHVRPVEQWRPDAERSINNQRRGSEQENRARTGLGEHLGRDLEDSNAAATRVQEGGTRPDSVGRNANGDIDVVHDHKHLSGEEQTVYNTDQFGRQRELAGEDGTHIVTMSSDRPDLDGTPPRPRPSGPLADGRSDIYYTDSESGQVTHEWVVDDVTGEGSWEEL